MKFNPTEVAPGQRTSLTSPALGPGPATPPDIQEQPQAPGVGLAPSHSSQVPESIIIQWLKTQI